MVRGRGVQNQADEDFSFGLCAKLRKANREIVVFE
jgi:hypothetical protein